jgi:predicted 2-oxoglutarate/Fe(II)-dependent dioxygenase YbiX
MDLEVFRRLGLFLQEDYLDVAERALILEAMAAAPSELARVHSAAGSYQVELETRRTRQMDVPEVLRAEVEARFSRLCQPLGEHFGMPLTGVQPVTFLAYEPGDFYLPHVDAGAGPGVTENSAARRVSVVVFLNGEGDSRNGDFQGGRLTVYGTMGPEGKEFGFPLAPRAGLLVAFPSVATHEVTPTTSGRRCSLVTWLV